MTKRGHKLWLGKAKEKLTKVSHCLVLIQCQETRGIRLINYNKTFKQTCEMSSGKQDIQELLFLYFRL